MEWLLLCLHLLLFHFPSLSSSFHSLCHPDQSSALIQFKTSFTTISTYYDPYDIYYCHQPYHKTATWENGTDCCSWLGVSCHPVSGHVISLDLSCEGLVGKFHPNNTLFHLSHLQSLNLALNNFSYSTLSPQFGRLTSLTHLNLSFSFFQGEIPYQISQLSKLTSLDFSWNSLLWKQNTWKRLFQNATALRKLVLDGTDLSSIRIMSLNLSSSLVTLSLRSSGLSGNLTNDILCLPNLQHLDLSRNHDLEGQLPELSCNTSLSMLNLFGCQFKGSIPSSLLTLPCLTDLYLSYNYLSGDIPNVFGGLTKLKTLDLSNNNLGGQIPSSLFHLTQLSSLDCSYNKLEGPLPDKVIGFPNLARLRLFKNLLNGTIPSWCLTSPSLTVLDLSDNQFIGRINEISSYSLKYLYLCANNLHGNIPESIFKLVNIIDLCLSLNNLSGPINFQLFSKLQNLGALMLSHNSQLSLNFKSNVSYSFPCLHQLSLSSINITEFPTVSIKFPRLTYLDLSSNKLNGRELNWLQEIESLLVLNLSQNLLTSSIDQFSRNYKLMEVYISFNLLDGDISSFCNASSLRSLDLSHNKFTGTIPPCLTNLSSLQVLDLQMNKFHGTLPNTFPKNNHLHVLHLSGNQLQGILPNSLSNCKQLEVLNLGNNQIEDQFPRGLETLPFLKVLVLKANKFYGPIFSLETKHSFPSLIIFDISHNNFSGPIPKAYIKNFEAMKNVSQAEVNSSMQYMEMEIDGPSNSYFELYYDSVTVTIKGINTNLMKIPAIFVNIDLSENKFEGEIPSDIGELHALKGLNLSRNRLTGPIPPSLGNLTNLESLDFSSNMLTGGIPTELTNLNYLEVLNLSENHLVGEIPQGKQFNTFLNDSYEGNLGLCGRPLSMKCGIDSEQHSPSSSTLQHEQKFGFGWKPVAIGYGCGMVFGVAMGCCVLLIGKPKWLVRMFGGNPNKRMKRKTKLRTHGRMTVVV